MSNVEKRKKLAAMLKGNDAMKIGSKNKLKRIALISVAAAVSAACSPLPVYAAALPEKSVKVIYTGDGSTTTVGVENAQNLDTFLNLMPNASTKPQEIYVVNKSSKQMKVYFQAVSANGQNAAVDLLQELDLKITFQMDDTGAETVLYDGKASGNASNASTNSKQVTDITKRIPLGFVYGKTTSGVLRATLTAPETMDNTFANANASIDWVFQFELADPTKPGGGGGGGGGGGTPVSTGVDGTATSIPTESISPDSTPQGGPAISAVPITEVIPNENVPLSKPPKTGESSAFLWIALVAALVGCIGFVASRGRMKSSK